MLTTTVNSVDNWPEPACTGGLASDERRGVLVIVGLIVLLVAGIITIVGAMSGAGAAHPPTELFVSGYDLTGRPARCSS
jgi:hypothetical protein